MVLIKTSLVHSTHMFRGCEKIIAVIILGSTEYHGDYLPLSIDGMIIEKLFDQSIAEIKLPDNICLLELPTIHYGYSIEWIRYPGTISLKPETLLAILRDIVYSLRDSTGINGVLIINGHGGNTGLLESFARELFFKNHIKTVVVDLWRLASRKGLGFCHACSFEIELAKKLGLPYNPKHSKSQHTGKISSHKDLIAYTNESIPGGGEIDVKEFIEYFKNMLRNAIKLLIS